MDEPQVIIDLTHELRPGVPVFPGSPPATFDPIATIDRDGYAELCLQMGTHTGTHVDAPCHVLPGARSLDTYPLDAFSGRAVVVDTTGSPQIELDHLRPLDGLDLIPDFILIRTGWDAKWGTPDYFGDFPTLTVEAAERLASLPIKGVGLDVASVDSVGAEGLPIHHILMVRDLLIIENLTRLAEIPPGPFEFFCTPLRLRDADASPVRAYARINTTA
ncbi:MAG: cyclase family protein [Phycisphaeraceae bacterium]|nr:MAG: cyclase family protein [Phycisphaeraceae bacterium]